jgi:hypothetical protein
VVLSSAREDGVGTPNCLYSAAQSPDGTYRSGRFADADAQLTAVVDRYSCRARATRSPTLPEPDVQHLNAVRPCRAGRATSRGGIKIACAEGQRSLDA